MKNAGKDRTGINTIRKSPAELPADPAAAQRRIRKMEGRYRRRVRQSVIAVIVASALFLVFAAGFKITSDNEQAIRLALGQKNYKEEGEEGAQYFAGEYTDPEELRADSAELGQRILDSFDDYVSSFKKIIPHEYAVMKDRIYEELSKGLSQEEAELEAFNALMGA